MNAVSSEAAFVFLDLPEQMQYNILMAQKWCELARRLDDPAPPVLEGQLELVCDNVDTRSEEVSGAGQAAHESRDSKAVPSYFGNGAQGDPATGLTRSPHETAPENRNPGKEAYKNQGGEGTANAKPDASSDLVKRLVRQKLKGKR